jgi:hypothetical protein
MSAKQMSSGEDSTVRRQWVSLESHPGGKNDSRSQKHQAPEEIGQAQFLYSICSGQMVSPWEF